MTEYYLGKKNIMIPFEAKDDNDALKMARTLIKGTNYHGFLLMNNETSRIFDMYGCDA